MDSLDSHIIEDNSLQDSAVIENAPSQLSSLLNPAPTPEPSLTIEVNQYSAAELDAQKEVLWNEFVFYNFSLHAKALKENGFCPIEDFDNSDDISIACVLKQFEQNDVDFNNNLDVMKMTGLVLNGVVLGTTLYFCPVQSITYFSLKLIEQAEWYSFVKQKRDLLSWQLSLHDVAETVSWTALAFCGGSNFYKTIVAPVEASIFKIPVDIVSTTISGTSIRPENYMGLAKFSFNEAGNLYKFISDACFEGMTDEVVRRLAANTTLEFYSLMDDQVGLIHFFASGVEEISDNIFDVIAPQLADPATSFFKLQLLKKKYLNSFKEWNFSYRRVYEWDFNIRKVS